jgi:hypothetical protein
MWRLGSALKFPENRGIQNIEGPATWSARSRDATEAEPLGVFAGLRLKLHATRGSPLLKRVEAQSKYVRAAPANLSLLFRLQGVEEFLKDRFNISWQCPDRDVQTLFNSET